MCSRQCGVSLRRAQATARRRAEPELHREGERERQRDRRRRRREAGLGEAVGAVGPVGREPVVAMSRAEWEAQLRVVAQVIAKSLVEAAARSRAEWERQVARLMRESAHSLAQAARDWPPVTRRVGPMIEPKSQEELTNRW